MDKIFKNFKEAALFAKKQSIELKTIHTVKREDNNWIVLSKGKSYSERIYTNKERKLHKKIQDLESRLETFERMEGERFERAEKLKKEKEEAKKERERSERAEKRKKEKEKKEREKEKKEREKKERWLYLKEQKNKYLSLSSQELDDLAESYIENNLSLKKDELNLVLEIISPNIAALRASSEKEKLNYLNERKEYYLSLSEGKLDELWLESDTLIETEKSLLRSVLRHKKGYGLEIKREYVPEFCGLCNMTIEVCTCKERSWW